MAKRRDDTVDKNEVSQLLGCNSDEASNSRAWSLCAPDSEEADLTAQVDSILSRLTPDLGTWTKLVSDYRVDLFCGLFLERPNRGVTVTPKLMMELGARGVELALDIYAPEHVP